MSEIANLSYKKSGIGTPLLILHGLYGSKENWTNISKKLSLYFEVYSLDLRNHGASSHHDLHDYPSMVEDLYFFLQENHIEKAIILGHSMGGKLAMFFGEKYPEKINRLIVVDISPKTYQPSFEHRLNFPTHDVIIQALMNINLANMKSREEVDRRLATTLGDKALRQFLLKNLEVSLAESENPVWKWKINLKSLNDNLPSILNGLEQKEVSASFPVLFIKGGNSDYILEEDIVLIKQLYKFVSIETIPYASHWLHAEFPEMFSELVIEFIFKTR